MDETHLPPLPVQPADQPSVKLSASNTDTKPKGVKLSDLNAVKQQTVTRAGVTLGAIGLLATASGTIGHMLPNWGDPASRPYPLLVYLAAILLPVGAYSATVAVYLSPDLQSELVARLKAAEGHPDAVSPELQSLFVQDIERCLWFVNVARDGLLLGGIALVIHAYSIILYYFMFVVHGSPIFTGNLPGSHISVFAVIYYLFALISIVVAVVLEFRLSWRSEAKRQKTPALPSAIGKGG